MAGSDEHLFRQFRLPWVPRWVPDWLEAMLRASFARKLLATVMLTIAASYFGWVALENQTGQDSFDTVAWEGRVDNSTNAELPLILDSLFQKQNDAAMALGVRQLTNPDPYRRQIATLALQDAQVQWRQWEPATAARQRERIVRLLAQVVGVLNAPEQALAVEVARQALLQPAANDPAVRDSLLANSRVLFAQAHPAHTAAVRWAAYGSESEYPKANQRETRDSWNRSPAVSRSSLPSDSVARSGSDSEVSSNRFIPAGFSRSNVANNPSQIGSESATRNKNGEPQRSQVPLFDDEGREIEFQPIDPTDPSTPGGLIPVRMASGVPTPTTNGQRPDEPMNTQTAVTDADLEFNSDPTSRVGGSRSDPAPIDAPAALQAPFVRQSELEAAMKLRAQSVSSSRRVPNETTPPQSQNRVNLSENSSQTETVISGSGPTVRPGFTGQTKDASSTAASSSPRPLPRNPYRGTESRTPEPQPLPTTPSESREAMGEWASLSHIEVMFRLRDENGETAAQAAKELNRRGFDSDYVAVARRLTSSDPLEREQLILDLVSGQRVEPLPFLRWLANDPDSRVQSLAVDALEMLNRSATAGNSRDRRAEGR